MPTSSLLTQRRWTALGLAMLAACLAVSGFVIAVATRSAHAAPLGTDVSDNIITDTTWTLAGSPYILIGNPSVNAGVTLTIQPGVLVQSNGGYLYVYGHLAAVGTAGQPITFTSSADTSPNQWGGLNFQGGTGYLRYATVRYAYQNIQAYDVQAGEVRIESSQILTGYQQSGVAGVYLNNSRVVVSDTLVSGNGRGVLVDGANPAVTITQSIIQNNINSHGVYANHTGGWMSLSNNTIQGNGSDGVVTSGPTLILNNTIQNHANGTGVLSWGDGVTVTNNTFTNNRYPVGVTAGNWMTGLTLSGNTFNTGAGVTNRIEVRGGNVLTHTTVSPNVLDYEVTSGVNVNSGIVLTVTPGMTLRHTNNGYWQVYGRLVAAGTLAQPITFTSSADNGPSQWSGLYFYGSSGGGTALLRYAAVRYAHTNLQINDVQAGEVRIESSQVLTSYAEGLSLSNSRVVVSDTLVSGSGIAYYTNPGIRVSGAAPAVTITQSTLQNNYRGLYTNHTDGLVTVSNSVIQNNNNDGVYVQSGPVSLISNLIQNNAGTGVRNVNGVTVEARSNWWGHDSGPGGEGPGTGDEVYGAVNYSPWLPIPDLNATVINTSIYAASSSVNDLVTWSGLNWAGPGAVRALVRVGNTPAPDVHWTGFYTYTSLPADLSALPVAHFLQWYLLTTTGTPDAGGVTVTHTPFTYTLVTTPIVTQNTTWDAAHSPYLVTRNLQIQQTRRLTLLPGTTVWFSDTRSIQVDGALVALGTPAQPITFTSWHPNKNADDWGILAFNGTAQGATFDGNGNYQSGSALQYATAEYGGVGYTLNAVPMVYMVDAPQTALWVDQVTLRNNGAGGIRSVGGRITNNLITGNTITATTDINGGGIANTGGGYIVSNLITSNTVLLSSYNVFGGGLYSAGGGQVFHNTITGTTVTASGVYGGGLYATGGGNIYSNTVVGNVSNVTSWVYGGGLYLDANTLATDNLVQDNRASQSYYYGGGSAQGGGIYATNNSTVLRNIVQGNQAEGYPSSAIGGGIYAYTGYIANNTVVSNTALSPQNAYGGGLYSQGVTTVTNNLLAQNLASGADARGGGVYGVSGGVFDNNIATYNTVSGTTSYGGGFYLADSVARNNTIGNNTAALNGGGVYWASGNGDLTHNTLQNNTALSNTAQRTGGVFVFAGPSAVINHNSLVGNNGYAVFNGNPASDTYLDLRYNWWGTSDPVAIQNSIYDWFIDSNSGFVMFSPFLFAPPNLNPAGVNLAGRAAGVVNTPYIFNASVYPISALRPITYVWEAAGQTPVVHFADALYDSAEFTWTMPGTYNVMVTASNDHGSAVMTTTITISDLASADAFEADNTCQQAKPLATTGVAQLHTFNTANDEDWAVFTPVAGVTYLLEGTTSDDSVADVKLDVYSGSCAASPDPGADNSFGPDVSLTFTAPGSGPIYVRLRNQAVSGGGPAAYYLSARALASTPPPGAVILVAGLRRANDPLQTNIYTTTNAMYRLFLANGYTANNIQYLAPDLNLNPDYAGGPDVDAYSTKSDLQDAITMWAKTKAAAGAGSLTLFLMDHGAYDLLYLNNLSNIPETVTPAELNTWLDDFEAAYPNVKVNIILEACQSGSFIDVANMISAPGRVVIASTGAYPLAYASPTGGAMFSEAFISALGRGMSLNSSFAEAKWTLQQAHPDQTPWLDDNGNGVPNELSDGQIAAQRGFAYAGTFSSALWPPIITEAFYDAATGAVQARVQAPSGRSVTAVWAQIYPPSYQPPQPGEELVEDTAPRVTLTDPNGDGLYTGNYNFYETGVYRVVAYATDSAQQNARPREALPGGASSGGINPATGGTVTAGNITLTFPPGAFTETTVITLSYGVSVSPAPSGWGHGPTLLIAGQGASGAVLQALVPFTITITYSDGEVQGLNPATLGLYYWDGNQWLPLASPALADANMIPAQAAGTLSGQTNHLATFAILGQLAAPPGNYFLYLPLIQR